jgi:serine/threonine protein kinase
MFPTDPVPDTIGAYKVLRRLAGSGSVSVYLGRMDGPMGFQRICELKLVPNAAEGEPRFAEELAREAAICAQLNHPAIVRMFDFFEHQNKLVLVLEHVEGASLGRLLQQLVSRRQKLGDAAVYYVAHSIASALAHAHAATDGQGTPTPVIHRNLHPENIVLGWDGQVRLTGFGLGKILGCTPDTVAGIVKGTPGYMAPEQVRGDKVSTGTDVYGVGLLLWSLLSGRHPPQDGTRPVGISTLRHDLPLSITAIIDTALSLAPEDRTIPCHEIEQILGKVVRSETGKSELVLRIQSAHSSIEIEDASVPSDRPTIPASRIRTGQTARPSGSLKAPVEEANATPRPPLKGTANADPRPAQKGTANADPRPAQTETANADPQPSPSGAAKAGPRPSSSSKGTANADPRLLLKMPPPPPKEKPPLPKRGSLRGAQSPNGPLKGGPPKDEAPETNHGKAPLAPLMVEQPLQAEAAPGVLPLYGSTAAIPHEEPARAAAAGPPAALASSSSGAATWEGLSPAAPRGVLDGEGVPAAPPAPFPISPRAPVRSVESPAVPAPPIAFGPLPNSLPAAPPPVTSLPFGPPPLEATPSPIAPPSVRFGSPPVSSLGGAPVPLASPASLMLNPSTPLGKVWAHPWVHFVVGQAQTVWRLSKGPRSLSIISTVAISALTATLVAAIWTWVAGRDPSPADVAATLSKTSTLPSEAKSSSPTPTRMPAALNAPKAPLTAAGEPANKAPKLESPANHPEGAGDLTVVSSVDASVYINGRIAGVANQSLPVRCGRWFVRLGRPVEGQYPEWVSAGKTVQVDCQAPTRVELQPIPSGAAPRPR